MGGFVSLWLNGIGWVGVRTVPIAPVLAAVLAVVSSESTAQPPHDLSSLDAPHVALQRPAVEQAVHTQPPAVQSESNEASLSMLPSIPSASPPMSPLGKDEPSTVVPAIEPRRQRPGDDLVREAAERMATHKTVQAMLRQQVRMFGQTLVGNGAYRQSRRGADLLLRMDLQLQLDDRAATYQQIADGRFLWKFQDSPDIKKLGAFKQSLTRVDLDVVRRSVPSEHSEAAPSRMGNIGYGGLPQFLGELVHHFTFDVPQSGSLHDVPVWILNGTWYEPALRQTMKQYRDSNEPATAVPLPEFAKLVESLPSQFPHRVSMAIGKDDLFPYRVEYRRQTDSESSSDIVVKSTSKAIVTLEFFQVQYDAPLDPNHFVRRAGDLPVRDVTAEFLTERGLEYRR